MRSTRATIAVMAAAGAFAALASAATPKFVGTLNDRYTLQVSGETGVRTAHGQVPLTASLSRALTQNGYWSVDLIGPNYIGGPSLQHGPGVQRRPARDHDRPVGRSHVPRPKSNRACRVAPFRRKITLRGSVKISRSGKIGEIDYLLWTCQGGLPPSAACLHNADGAGIPAPSPIAVKAGEEVALNR